MQTLATLQVYRQLQTVGGSDGEHTEHERRDILTGKTEPTVTRKRPTGATPTPKGQPLDKAENSRGARLMNFNRKTRKVVLIAKL